MFYNLCVTQTGFGFTRRGNFNNTVRWLLGLMASATIALLAGPTGAKEPEASIVPNRVYFFSGVDIGSASHFYWAGITSAPFGGLDDDGIRLRLFGGAGHYRYQTQSIVGGENSGNISAGEVLIGKRLCFDPTTITAYVGVDIKNYGLALPDPGNRISGTKLGIKFSGEAYTRLTPEWFVTAYGNISSVYRAYGARAAIIRDLTSNFTLGAEGAVMGDALSNEIRVGIVAGTKFGQSIATIAGGVAQNSDRGSGLYTTLTYYVPF